jgi:methylenetetrahydrofolate/methylenetetrahydromethanopterin dehydrogenase (NADP+)
LLDAPDIQAHGQHNPWAFVSVAMKRILIQLDSDPQPSTFDRVVAIDADVDQLFSYGGVAPEAVETLVHGAIFSRGMKDLASTAIFIGGSDVAAGEALLKRVCDSFVGPMRVSVMMDANGSNTTSAAAVLSAQKHLKLSETTAVVLAGTGPVGLRAAQILAAGGSRVRVGSRSLERAIKACHAIRGAAPQAEVTPCATGTAEELERACQGVSLVIAAGAAGAELLSSSLRKSLTSLKVAIDLNAVPPVGIAGIEVFDKGAAHDGALCYGAIGVGGLKMKIHKAALRKLFETNDQILDRDAIYAIGGAL